MWKHKTKWLVRGGRKVRCYLCGKKILTEGDLFLFHGDTGYYSHQSCQVESTTISGNERRKAVKKIAVGAAVVGAIAAGAGKFLDVSSQSKNSPAAQTILTSQGLIPPALTSDPANPVPGQMWYRSDAGVMAHFDAIENRVIYSNRIVDGSAVVTSKGIVNGLSVLLNDGQDWGPDTTKGATAPGQYGSPYTVSVGLQESVNYVYNQHGGRVFIKNGHYVISAYSQGLYSQGGIVIPYTPATDAPIPIEIEGESSIFAIYQGSTSGVSGNGPGLTPMGTNGVVIDISNLDNSSGQSLLTAAIVGDFDNGASFNFSNTAVKIVNIATLNAASPSTCGFYFYNTSSAVLTDVVAGVVQTDTGFINSPNTNRTGGITNAGISMPHQTNAGGSVLDRAFVFGFFFGLQFASHFVGGTIMIMYCYQPISVTAGGHTATILKLDIENSSSWFAGVEAPTHIVKLETQVISTQSTEWYNANVNELFANPGSYTKLLRIDELMYNNTSGGNIALPSQTNLDASDYANISIGIGTYGVSLSIPANPPVSGTTYQNTNLFDIRLKIPVTYSPTSSAAATLATGISSTSTVTTSTKVSIPAGVTAGEILTYDMVVPAGQYFELVVTNATIGTVEVEAA